MSTFSFNKSGNDSKSNTLGSVNRQNVIQEANKKRTLLKDSSWIKAQPEEEVEKIKDENYGRNVLSRYKSQEDLDRDNDKVDNKPIHNRFKSDDALDRISLRNTSERGNKSATLERIPMSETETTNKRQSWTPSNKTTTTTTTEESKRKSWGPTTRNTTFTTTTTAAETKPVLPGKPDKPEGQKITIYSSDTRNTDKPIRTNFIDSARSRFEKTDTKPSPPTSPIAKTDTRVQNVDEKPKLSPIAKNEDRASYSTKPAIPESGERRSAVERKQRSQDFDNLIDVSSSKVVSSKGTQDINNLIDIKTTADKGKKRDQLDDLIEISKTVKNTPKRDGDLDNLIEIKKPEVKTRDGDLNTIIEIKKPDAKTRTQNIDNLIDVKSTTTNRNKGSQSLDDLIAIAGDGNQGVAKPGSNKSNVTSQSSAATTTYNVVDKYRDAPDRQSTTSRTYNVTDNSQDAPSRRSTTTTTYKATDESQDAPSRRSTTTTTYKVTDDSQDAPSRRSTTTTTYKNTDDFQDAPSRRSTTTTTYKDNSDATTRRSTKSFEDNIDGPNSGSNVTFTQETRYSTPPAVYSTYGDSSIRTSNTYGENIPSNSIKTVYSTSNRFGIEKDMCTYCRKPLGIDAKMILKDMNICCHATCFKCEACSDPLGNMKAGDSMWIYKQTIHCEPCYFAAREKWII
ncbi:sciellin isoform X2 [Mixophyes fleayi]|uniref:sciellin isoform X2 n=1 Tax=Mixophyes fleayi TaxID=3061075 RepID=UPI003F4DA628